MRGRALAVLGLAAILIGGPAVAEDLVTGNTVYELSLEPGKSMGPFGSISGRMESSLLRSCDRYETSASKDAKVTVADGRELPMIMESSFVETAMTLRFDLSGKIGPMVIEDAYGLATRTEKGLRIVLDEPDSKTIDFTGGAVSFPIAQVTEAIASARAGEHFFHARIFDGSGKGDVWSASIVVGDPRSANETEDEKLFADALGLADVQRWPMKFSYFAPDAAGEQSPSFSTDAVVYKNGFVLGAVYDLDRFAMRLKMVEFKPVTPKPCE